MPQRRRIRVLLAERRPPLAFQRRLEGAGVVAAEDVPGDALLVGEHAGEVALEQHVRSGVDVTHHIRRAPVAVGGGAAHLVDARQIGQSSRAGALTTSATSNQAAASSSEKISSSPCPQPSRAR